MVLGHCTGPYRYGVWRNSALGVVHCKHTLVRCERTAGFSHIPVRRQLITVWQINLVCGEFKVRSVQKIIFYLFCLSVQFYFQVYFNVLNRVWIAPRRVKMCASRTNRLLSKQFLNPTQSALDAFFAAAIKIPETRHIFNSCGEWSWSAIVVKTQDVFVQRFTLSLSLV